MVLVIHDTQFLQFGQYNTIIYEKIMNMHVTNYSEIMKDMVTVPR